MAKSILDEAKAKALSDVDPHASDEVQVRVWVSGRVQGVAFRAYTREEARRLGVNGWVKNLPDGRVQILAQGPRADLERLTTWCHQGSPFAAVKSVDVEWEPLGERCRGFDVTF